MIYEKLLIFLMVGMAILVLSGWLSNKKPKEKCHESNQPHKWKSVEILDTEGNQTGRATLICEECGFISGNE